MKVFELSKELNMENKDLIKICNDMGFEIKSHMSVLTDEQIQVIKDVVNANNTEENSTIEKSVESVKIKHVEKEQWKPDLTRMICVKNIARGKLVYKSKRQLGYTLEWDKKGDINYIELGEFINLKNTDRRFITEPWIRIVEDDEVEILKYANILQHYKEIIGIDNVSEILKLDFERFKKKFDKLPDGYKNTVAEYAAEMIRNGELDSIKIKNYIEEVMDIDLDILTKTGFKKKSESIDIK
jgi:hypothetical protein